MYCEKCGEKYTKTSYRWCKQCDLKVTNQISGNEQIDNLIQEMQLKIKHHNNVVFEWIPYNQFVNIKKIGKDDFEDDFDTIYSAIWKDGPLYYDTNKYEYTRKQNGIKVALKYLHINELLNEVYKVWKILDLNIFLII